jgi:hypothetical protein
MRGLGDEHPRCWTNRRRPGAIFDSSLAIECNYRREAVLQRLGEDGPVAQMAATTGSDMLTYTRQYPAISD